MPELPEAETLRRQLHRALRGATIARTVVLHPWVARRQPRRPGLRALTEGRRIAAVARRGKVLCLTLEPAATLVIRLGMSGRTLVTRADAPPGPHSRVRFLLTDGRELRFDDQRMFGAVLAYPTTDPDRIPPLAALGPDALDPAFTADRLAAALARRRAPVIALLMNQRLQAGVGNIYANEACFLAGIRPRRAGGRVRPIELVRLHAAIRHALDAGVRHRGTSIRDGLYRNADGTAGAHQHHLFVYGREGEPCRRCAAPIVRHRHQGRSVFYCPRCQR